jgi:hypothetical protein
LGCAEHLASTLQKKQLPRFGSASLMRPPLQGFDGYKWLSDLHVLDVGKLEEGAITSARCVADAGRTSRCAFFCVCFTRHVPGRAHRYTLVRIKPPYTFSALFAFSIAKPAAYSFTLPPLALGCAVWPPC